MRRAQVAEIVKRIRYKPGWKIRVDDTGEIEIVAHVKDAYHPGRWPVNQPHAYVVNPQTARTESALCGRIFDACQRLEFHEVTEWFMYKGKRIYDTHS